MRNIWVMLDWVGRIGVAALFVKSGINHIRKRQAMLAYVQAKHLPLAWLDVVGTGVMMLAGSVLLVSNWHPHWGAALIILFLVPTAFLMHNYWKETDPMVRGNQDAHFWKNITIAFALVLYIVQGHLYR
jgi:putative oxidoreductase